MRVLSFAFTACLLTASLAPAFECEAQETRLFDTSEILEMSVTLDLSKLRAEKETLREVGVPAVVALGTRKLNAAVMPRGAGSFECEQPQLKFNFKSAAADGSPFSGFKKIKLFTSGRCLKPVTDPEQDKVILSNYLIYKLQDELFAETFKTRLVRIFYTDSSGKSEPYTQLGFFLEPESHIRQRLGLTHIEPEELQSSMNSIFPQMDQSSVSLMHAFQFFIGNFDYGIPGIYSHIMEGAQPLEKNIQLFKSADNNVEPLAYDFDLSRLTYIPEFCGLSMSFFMNNEVTQACDRSQLAKTYKSDLSSFKFSDDVKTSFPKIKEAFSRWKTKYAPELKLIGIAYVANLDIFLDAFEQATL